MSSDRIPVKDDGESDSSLCPEVPVSLDKLPLELIQEILEQLQDDKSQLLACRLLSHFFEEGVSSLLRFKTLTNWIKFNKSTGGIIPKLRLTPESQNAPEEERELKVCCRTEIGVISSPTNSLRVKRDFQGGDTVGLGHCVEVGLESVLFDLSHGLCALSLDHLIVFPSKLFKILESVPHLKALELSHITLKTDCDTPNSELPALPDLTFLKLKRVRSLLKKDVNYYFYGYITNQLLELEVDGVNYPALGVPNENRPNAFHPIRSLKTLVVTTPTRRFLQKTPSTWLKRLSIVRFCPIEDITSQELFEFLNKFSGTLVELLLEPSWLYYDHVTPAAFLNNFHHLKKFVVTYPDGEVYDAALIRSLMRKFGMLETLHFEHFVFKESAMKTDATLELEKMIQFLNQEGYWTMCPKLFSIHAIVRIPRKQKGSKILASSKIWERT